MRSVNVFMVITKWKELKKYQLLFQSLIVYFVNLFGCAEFDRKILFCSDYDNWVNFSCSSLFIREIKIHAYGIRQTANVSWKFLRIENKQIKTVQNDSCGQNWHKTTYFCVEAINSKRKIRGKLGHVVQIHVCRLA